METQQTSGQLSLLLAPPIQRELQLSRRQLDAIARLPRQFGILLPAPSVDLFRMSPQQRAVQLEALAIAARRREQALDERLQQILDETQHTRLQQLQRQATGPRALLDESLAEQLELSQQQREQIARTLAESAVAASRRLAQAAPAGGAPQMRVEAERLQQQMTERVLSHLTPEQRAQYREALGEPFEIDWREIANSRRQP